MKGVMLSYNQSLQLVDLTHLIPPHAIAPAAFFLTQCYPFFPSGTVHLAVIDPGVGGRRKAAVVATSAAILIGPDNGLLWPVVRALGGGRWFSLENPDWQPTQISSTFHGRDLFAPAAARLACGLPARLAGPEIKDPVRFELPKPQKKPEGWQGEVLYIDRFGNCLTNLPRLVLEAENPDLSGAPNSIDIKFGDHMIHGVSECYQSVDPGCPLAVWGSGGVLEIAVHDGSAAAKLGIGVGTPVTLFFRKSLP
jgi:S-adenosylmethionine hydrolase